MKKLTYFLILSLFLSSACSTFFGSKTDIGFIQIPDYSVKAVAYVPIQPVISGFTDLSDICNGFDNLIYVVDKGTQEIIAYNESMVKLGSKLIPGVTKVAQDRKLGLIALGTLDTTINGNPYTLACIYRLELKNAMYGISQAQITKKIVHPFYVNSGVKAADVNTRFTGVAVLADNSYYITRTGSSQNNLIGGPDDAALYFDADDTYNYYIQVITQDQGLRSDYFKAPAGITSFIQPPQANTIRDVRDFAYISNNPGEALKVKLISYAVVDGSPTYQLNQDLIVGDTSKASGFLYTPGKFGTPSDITFSGDGTQLIFVTDSQKDSLYIFSNTGLEGVPAPAGSPSLKNIKVSFGGKGQDLTKFNAPSAVAYNDKIVYVADAGNQRILRFKLTTDFK